MRLPYHTHRQEYFLGKENTNVGALGTVWSSGKNIKDKSINVIIDTAWFAFISEMDRTVTIGVINI